jgi:hypothetical protein
MAIISIRSDIDRFARTLDDFQRTQLRYATARALTRTAKIAAADIKRQIPSVFTAKGPPVPFTINSVGFTHTDSRSKEMRTNVFVKTKQGAYLSIEETGGSVRSGPGHPIITPVNIDVNRYGNIPRGKLKALVAGDPKRYFRGSVRGVYGWWERLPAVHGQRGRLRLLAAVRSTAHYRPRFGFQRMIATSVKANLVSSLSAGMAEAMKTAIRR